MKNILKLMTLLTLGASIVPVYADEEQINMVGLEGFTAAEMTQLKAELDEAGKTIEQTFNDMTPEQREQFFKAISEPAAEAHKPVDDKPNTLAAYAEAGICGMLYTSALASASYVGHQSYILGALYTAACFMAVVGMDQLAYKLFSKATRERAHEIRKAWVTLEFKDERFKQKLFDSAFFIGSWCVPFIALNLATCVLNK